MIRLFFALSAVIASCKDPSGIRSLSSSQPNGKQNENIETAGEGAEGRAIAGSGVIAKSATPELSQGQTSSPSLNPSVIDPVPAGNSVNNLSKLFEEQVGAAQIEARCTFVAPPILDFPAPTFDGTSAGDFFGGTEGVDVVRGNDGNDRLMGLDGNDFIHGNMGADYINGNAGADQLHGGAGNDEVRGGAGSDIVIGGGGSDLVVGGGGNDYVRGDDGDDVVLGLDGNDQINGNMGADVVNGNMGDDLAAGGAGNDHVHGGQGNDCVIGGGGDDKVYGGKGSDLVFGRDGADMLFPAGPNCANLPADAPQQQVDWCNGEGQNVVACTDPTGANCPLTYLYGEAGNDTYVIQKNVGRVFINADVVGNNTLLCDQTGPVVMTDIGADRYIQGQGFIVKVRGYANNTTNITLNGCN